MHCAAPASVTCSTRCRTVCERQRLTIARLLLARPRVVILDEATAHLDSESEAAVQAALAAALEGRTAIVIAHRLSTVRAADEIAVVEGGRVAERGTHDDLLGAGGRYAALYRTQFADHDPTDHDPTGSAVDPPACPVPGCDLVHLRAVGAEFPSGRGVDVKQS
jgi:ATP-binding cassette, subfamily B, bacterial